MVSKTGYPEPLAKRALASKRDSEAIEGVTGAASGGVQKAFLAASVADSLPHTFQEASRINFGNHFEHCPFWSPRPYVLCLHFSRHCLSVAACCARLPKFECFGRLENCPPPVAKRPLTHKRDSEALEVVTGPRPEMSNRHFCPQ